MKARYLNTSGIIGAAYAAGLAAHEAAALGEDAARLATAGRAAARRPAADAAGPPSAS